VLFYVLFVCKCVLPPSDNPNAVNKYIISSLSLGIGWTGIAQTVYRLDGAGIEFR
jgi:hypothetical protein